jgi:hypothetical protein
MGHHDSPYIFSFTERYPRVAFVRFFLAMLFYGGLCVYSLAASVREGAFPNALAMSGTFLWIAIAGLPFVMQLFFMMGRAPSPGSLNTLRRRAADQRPCGTLVSSC